jgi:xanthine dehydrogenase accessory protein XdhC
MNNWISALAELQQQGEPCVLVTIIEEQGSTPRNTGSKMVICADKIFDTIGGGHLEYKAMEIARQMLDSGKHDTHLQRFSLGASLGQCCGGWPCCCSNPWARCKHRLRCLAPAMWPEPWYPCSPVCPAGCAGSTLGSRNSRQSCPRDVEKIVTDEPVDEVDALPAGCYCIVMTHNHALDLELSAALLKRNDFTYFGLIGSKTKRVKFEHRLRERGIAASPLQRMRCPMGLSEVKGKLPVEIAISIAGEIIATYNTHFGQHTVSADSASSESIKQLLPSSRRSHATH